MPESETTNVMTLKLTDKNLVKRDPPALRVLAGRKEIILRGDPGNTANIEVRDFTKKLKDGRSQKVNLKDVFIVDDEEPELPLVISKGQEVRLRIRQDLPIEKRGTFEHDNNDKFSRRMNLKFNFERDSSGDHEDWHIEC
jgi:hypothetical protein